MSLWETIEKQLFIHQANASWNRQNAKKEKRKGDGEREKTERRVHYAMHWRRDRNNRTNERFLFSHNSLSCICQRVKITLVYKCCYFVAFSFRWKIRWTHANEPNERAKFKGKKWRRSLKRCKHFDDFFFRVFVPWFLSNEEEQKVVM